MCAYLRIPDSWRTGEGSLSQYRLVQVNKKLVDFAKDASVRSGLYLNGIDYIYHDGKYVLIEVNAAPGIRDPYDDFKIDTPKMLLDHIERSVAGNRE
jgi:glutathione synthase/RimK-type ligase-like ATP-grasp enzyme